MTVVLAHTNTPEGEAAYAVALAEAARRRSDLVIFPMSGEPNADGHTAGVTITVRRAVDRNRDVVGECLSVVKDVGADMIVIGIRRRTAVGKLLMGSTAQSLMLASAVPVLAVQAAESVASAALPRPALVDTH